MLFFYLFYKWDNSPIVLENRSQLELNFIEHEKKFQELTSFFSDKVKDVNQRIYFSVEKNEKISLLISPEIISSSSKTIGKENVNIESTDLESALKLLQWDRSTLYELRKKLTLTNCDVIRTTEIKFKPLELYSKKSAWGSYSYLIFKRDLIPDQIRIYGKTISKTDFGRKVVLEYSSAL